MNLVLNTLVNTQYRAAVSGQYMLGALGSPSPGVRGVVKYRYRKM